MTTEAWLEGPLPGISPLLQPVAHALVQSRREVRRAVASLPASRLWDRPGGAASPGFHLQHLAGVIDRMLTYARGKSLSGEQLAALESEGSPRAGQTTPEDLFDAFDRQVSDALRELASIPAAILTEPREVGRKRMPSTVLGLLVHAAEHTARHTGQFLVTVKVLGAQED